MGDFEKYILAQVVTQVIGAVIVYLFFKRFITS